MLVISIQNLSIPFSSSLFPDTLSSSQVPSFLSSSSLRKGSSQSFNRPRCHKVLDNSNHSWGGSSEKKKRKIGSPQLSVSQRLLFLILWSERDGYCWSFYSLYLQYIRDQKPLGLNRDYKREAIHRTLTPIKVFFLILMSPPNITDIIYFSKYKSSFCLLPTVFSCNQWENAMD